MGNQFERTNQAIISAFVRLLEVKSFENITIQNILDETPISRSSFYAHFHDKYEIAEYLQDMIYEKIDIYRHIFLEMNNLNDKKKLQEIFISFRKYRPILIALLSIKTEKVDIIAKLSNSISEEYLENKEITPFVKAEADMYSAIMVQLMLYSLTNEVPYERLLEDLSKLQIKTFLSLFHLQDDVELYEIIKTHLALNNTPK